MSKPSSIGREAYRKDIQLLKHKVRKLIEAQKELKERLSLNSNTKSLYNRPF